MKYLVFDIETTEAVGPGPLTDLDISVVSVYNSEDGQIHSFLEKDFGKMWKMFEETDAIVGYNSEHFDIPILNKYYPGDLSQIKSIDMLVYIRESFGKRVKLDSIAEATLGTKKIAQGLKAVEWWKEGKIDEIIKYCEMDVEITQRVFQYALDNGHLKLKDFSGQIINIPINTETWMESEDSGMTHTMGF